MDTMPIRRFVLAFVVIALVSSACIWSNDDEQPSPTPATSPTGSLLPSTPDSLPTMDAEDFRSMVDQLGGTPLVVNVWASWCEPCERETPMLTAAAADHPGVRFVGVNTQDSREGAEAFIEQYSIPYPSVFDPDGAIITDLDALGPPVTVFYDEDGTQVASVVGELSQQALDQHLAEITS
jgi:cytochrome c biogenesis protein CcmG/thiol:disulfide interchange protein DsbE